MIQKDIFMHQFVELSREFKGFLFYDDSVIHQTQLMAYATDASVYQEKPLAVSIPKDVDDLKLLIGFATKNQLTLIPRAAGTSLAGQVVGSGVVVDISKFFDQIIEVNVVEKWVRVQPGVIRDDLNKHLKPYGLMFGPETSTANRAMIGGMVGNNSCGLHSIVWGNVRDHLIDAKVLLSDGNEYLIDENLNLNNQDNNNLAASITYELTQLLSNNKHQQAIKANFPKASVSRRNSGYALDALIEMQPFNASGRQLNLCTLLAGSEGTLAFSTELKLNLIDLPPKNTALVCVHTSSIDDALRANIIALKHQPTASELVDKFICDFTIGHPEYHKHRFFMVGDPEAILMVEFMEHSQEALNYKVEQLMAELKLAGNGYAYKVLVGKEIHSAWEIRKAGLGLLRNLKGDWQPVNLIEDCAVSPDELPDYVMDLQQILDEHKVKASYYAHAGAGELHIEPIINLKTEDGRVLFRTILQKTALLIKKYQGSLSGEHGDGRLRGEFIQTVMGAEVYALFEKVKEIFDPQNIFNAGKITNTPAMDSHFRASLEKPKKALETTFDFSEVGGMKALAEKCSGSGDCRKSAISGGVMCPSYMATRLEKDTTRARANILRQFLSNPKDSQPLIHQEISEVLDLCISCKGCKTECPSGVDVTKMKAEYLQQRYDEKGSSLRAKMIANFGKQMKLASIAPSVFNKIFGNTTLRKFGNSAVGFHPDRSIPLLHKTTLLKWYKNRKMAKNAAKKTVYFFCDEFTNYNDVEIGKTAILLLEAIGFNVIIPEHIESGRTYLSKGFVKKAKAIANQNIELLNSVVTADAPLVGVEPSAILTLRDEYIDLAIPEHKESSIALAKNTFTIDEFIALQIDNGYVTEKLFNDEEQEILIHGHCYQKALSSELYLLKMLNLPKNCKATLIPSGCCGMAGSFGYEKEHFDVSQKIGELVLYPAVRNRKAGQIIAASGTSCRHQIKDGTAVNALHPVEILYKLLKKQV